MLTNKLIPVLKELLPEIVITESESSNEPPIAFHLEVNSIQYRAYAFILSEEVVFQFFCNAGADPKYAGDTLKLLNNLNSRIPFGNFQMGESGEIILRTYLFLDDSVDLKNVVQKALDWSEIVIDEHITGILSVADGYTNPDHAIEVMQSRTESRLAEKEAHAAGVDEDLLP